MKKDIHPNYQSVVFLDTTTGFKFLSGSTKGSKETVEWEDGNTYPLIRVEISSDSHPTLAVKNSKQRTDVSLVSTRNMENKKVLRRFFIIALICYGKSSPTVSKF